MTPTPNPNHEADTRLLPNHKGKYYVNWILDAVRLLGARNYFEIGSRDGNSLRGVGVPSIAVDPHFDIASNIIGTKPQCSFYQCTSDNYFKFQDPTEVLKSKIDFAFLDGLHIYEFLLRDFLNTERYCAPNSLICLHDCLPCKLDLTVRRQPPMMAWTGDVWKVPAILQKHRPDIRIHYFDCPPTGLVVCTNLDPHSRVIQNNYFDIIQSFSEDYDGRLIKDFYSTISVKHASEALDLEDLAQYFWL